MIKVRDTFLLERHGPCIVAQDKKTTPPTFAVLTWDGKCIWVYDYELLPFPMRDLGKVLSVPNYEVTGVAEIVALEVDLNENSRPRSRLTGPFSMVERYGDLHEPKTR